MLRREGFIPCSFTIRAPEVCYRAVQVYEDIFARKRSGIPAFTEQWDLAIHPARSRSLSRCFFVAEYLENSDGLEEIRTPDLRHVKATS